MAHVAAWYRREDYQRIRAIMDDGDKLPREFDEWEKVAKRQVALAARQGAVIEPVILDPDEFIAFCESAGLPKSGEARAAFAVSRGTNSGAD